MADDKKKKPSQENLDNHANQKNKNNPAYKKAQDNRSRQINPNHDTEKKK